MNNFYFLVLAAILLTACSTEIISEFSPDNVLPSVSDKSSSSALRLSSSVLKLSSSSVVVKSSSSSALPSSSSVAVSSSSSSLGPSSSSSVFLPSSSSIAKPSSSSQTGILYGTLVWSGKAYKTVKIGNKTWMVENLNYNGLYTWAEAMNLPFSCNLSLCGGRIVSNTGICPNGWHLPNDEEWLALFGNYIDGSRIFGAGYSGSWWSSNMRDSQLAWSWHLSDDQVSRFSYDKSNRYSVRCVED